MLSRRNLLRHAAAGTSGIAFSALDAFGASDFWNKKDPAEWSEKERDDLKTKSPWAKKVHGEGGGGRRGGGSDSMDRSGSKGTFGGMSGADSNGISEGGGRGGGRGGGGGAGGLSAPSNEGPEVVIRWESAEPVIAATKRQLPAQLAEHYAVSITGLPPQIVMAALLGSRGRGARDGAPSAVPEQLPADPAAEAKARQDRLLHAATLSAKNKDPQAADVVLQTSDRQTLFFGFPKNNLPLAATDKDVEFILRLGPATFKAKFEPKEMMYKGALSI